MTTGRQKAKTTKRDRLIVGNLKLVQFMINHTPMLYRLGMDYDDKVGAGYLGLVKAADSFLSLIHI